MVGLLPLPRAACLLHMEAPSPGPTCCRCGNGFMTAWVVLLTRSQRLPSRAPWGGWGSPLPGRGREKEVDLNPPLSLSVSLPSRSPPAPFLPPGSWVVVRGLPGVPGHQAPACKKPRGSVPVPLLAKPGLSLLVVVSVATQSRFPEPLGLAAALFFIEEVVEGVACFS